MNKELTSVFDWLIERLANIPFLSQEKATQILTTLSEIAFVTKDYEKLEEFVNNHRSKAIFDERIFYHQGNIFYEQGDMKPASIFYKIATILKENFPEAWYNWGLTLYNMAMDSSKPKEMYEEAIDKYKKAAEYDPNNAVIYNNLGDCHYRLGEPEEYINAINIYNKALELNDRYLKAYYNRGLAFACLQDYTKAIQDFEKVIELNPSFAEAYHIRGLAYHYRASTRTDSLEIEKDLDFAVKDYRKSLELSPDFTECSYHLALALYDFSEYDKDPLIIINRADELFSQIIAKTPPEGISLADIWNDWGNLLYKKAAKSKEKKKFYCESAEKYERALELESQKTHILENLINTLIAIAHTTGGLETFDWFQKALDKCEKALEFNPNNSEILYWYGYAFSKICVDPRKDIILRKELAKKAVLYSERLFELDQSDPYSASSLAITLDNVYAMQENPAEILKRSLSLFENIVLKQERILTWQKCGYAQTLLDYTILCPANEVFNVVSKAKAILIESSNEDSQDSSIFSTLGVTYESIAEITTGIESLSNYQKAVENFEKSASLTLIDEYGNENLGRAYICRYFAEGIKDYLDLAKQQFDKIGGEENPSILFQLARIAALKGDKETAIQLIKKALEGCWILPQYVQRDPTLRDIIKLP